MKGDFTRFTHDGEKHFNRLYRQQGRVELDADFNEAADLATELARVQTVDVIGRTGVPKDDSFKIDRELLDDLLDTMEITSLCALGGGVPLPIKNALQHFDGELQSYFQR